MATSGDPPSDDLTDAYFYGNKNLSDVVLLVEGAEIHVHKMVLACRSSYFAALFYGEFKEKDEARITLKATNLLAFRRLMDCVYNGKIETNATDFVDCKKEDIWRCKESAWHQEMWKQSAAFIECAKYFDFYNIAIYCLEELFVTVIDCKNLDGDCSNDAWRMLVAMTFGMKKIQRDYWMNEGAMLDVCKSLKPLKPEFTLSVEDIECLISRVFVDRKTE